MEQLKNMNSSLENDKTLGEFFFPDDKEMAATYVALVESSFYLNRNFLGVFLNHFLPNFENAAIAHFTKFPIIDDLQQPFINSLTPFWNELIKNQQYVQSQILWKNVLQMVQRLSERFHHRIHRGAIFYYWGISAILNGELEKGYRLMGKALAEDRVTYGEENPGTPAHKFVYLNYADKQHNFKYFVDELKKTLDDQLYWYKQISSSSLDIDQIQKKYLSVHPCGETVLLLNYSLARIGKLKNELLDTDDNLFAGILDLNLLADIILIVDNSFKAKVKREKINQYKENFGAIANRLWEKANSKFIGNRIDTLNQCIEEKKGLSLALRSLLVQKISSSKWDNSKPIEFDIAVTYLLRNYSAHNINPDLILPINTFACLRSIFNVLFFIVDEYYVKNEGFIE